MSKSSPISSKTRRSRQINSFPNSANPTSLKAICGWMLTTRPTGRRTAGWTLSFWRIFWELLRSTLLRTGLESTRMRSSGSQLCATFRSFLSTSCGGPVGTRRRPSRTSTHSEDGRARMWSRLTTWLRSAARRRTLTGPPTQRLTQLSDIRIY